MAVNLAGGGGGDLKQLMAEHSLGVKEDTSNSGISLDVVYLKQAEHLMRSDNYKTAIKYTHKALEINPEMTVSKNFQPVMRPTIYKDPSILLATLLVWYTPSASPHRATSEGHSWREPRSAHSKTLLVRGYQ